mgnify:CR=1 FL=1
MQFYAPPQDLRLAIGIAGTGFELSDEDYYALYSFDPPDQYEVPQAYEVFKKSCEQVGAKYPTMAVFKKIYRRYDRELEADE